MSAPHRLSIDIWSDVMCPWCVIGYKAMKRALEVLEDEIEATVRWRPFELNPDMPAGGEDMVAHMRRKYGRAPDPAMTGQMVELAARVGYDMRYLGPEPEPERRLWNTLSAHKLLRWTLENAGAEAQTRLKLALFDAYFQQRRDVSDPVVLTDVVREVLVAPGLTRGLAIFSEPAQGSGIPGQARDDEDWDSVVDSVLADEALTRLIRAEEAGAHERDINAVPAIVIEDRYMIAGAQDPDVYVNILRRVVARAGLTNV